MTTAIVTPGDRLVCQADGAGVFYVEHLEDFALERRSVVFTCGHRAWVDRPMAPVVEGLRCTECGGPKGQDGHRKCPGCRVCLRCPAHAHTVAACPKGRGAGR